MAVSKKTFKDLISKVNLENADIGIEIIREYFENFVIEIGLELRKIEEQTISVSEADNFSLGEDVISVYEVYLDDVLMKPMSWEDYKTSEYTSNTYCYINNAERKIYFPTDLDGTEELKILAVVAIDSVSSIDPTTELDIPNFYLLLATYYILKEIFHSDKFYNREKIIRFEKKYNNMLNLVKSNPLDIKRKSTMKQLKDYDFGYN